MKTEKKIQLDADASRQVKKLSLFAVFYSFAVCQTIFWTAKWAGSDSFHLLLVPYVIAFLLAISSYVLGYLGTKAAIEEEDRMLLEKRKEKKALESGEDVLFSALRTFIRYVRYSPYVISILNFMLIGMMLAVFWYVWIKRADVPVPVNPSQTSFLSLIISLFSIFFGVFCIGQSRTKNFRWLRTLGGWLVFAAALGMLTTFALFMYRFNLPVWDRIIKGVIFSSISVLGIELILNFTIEFYRPRTMGEEKPIFESRLLSLFTEPGGVMRNITETLDYQFGFKVSRVWLYAFFEKSIIPLVIAWLVSFWLFTCVAEVKPGELGIRENFGGIADKTALSPGVYFKLPWPFGRMVRIPIDKIQEMTIGAEMKDENGNIKNSVNFPETHLDRSPSKRLTIANQNLPGMIEKITHLLAENKINIADMINKSKGSIAYNIIDIDGDVNEGLIGKIGSLEGVLAIRVL